jgi:hypothetical protein
MAKLFLEETVLIPIVGILRRGVNQYDHFVITFKNNIKSLTSSTIYHQYIMRNINQHRIIDIHRNTIH